jgi:hypothetical protein
MLLPFVLSLPAFSAVPTKMLRAGSGPIKNFHIPVMPLVGSFLIFNILVTWHTLIEPYYVKQASQVIDGRAKPVVVLFGNCHLL